MKIETDIKVLKSIQAKVPRVDNPTRDNPSRVLERKKSHSRKNNTDKPKVEQTHPTWVEQYMFLNSWNVNEASEDFINKLASDLVAFAYGDPKINAECREMIGEEFRDSNKPITLNDFMALRGIWHESLTRWRNKFPQLESAYKQAKLILAARRENGICHNKLSYNPIAKTQHFYCQIWADSEDRQAKLRTPEQTAAGEIKIIEVPAFPKEEK